MLQIAEKYRDDLIEEFDGYGAETLRCDIFAGITVAAVSLPLAVAFGVSSGADAASGLISAIISAFVIGALSGASFQISGPTGAMTAILMPLAAKHGIEGVFLAGALAGLVLIAAGVLRLGRLVYYLPSPVITGFTSGIAVIIAMGQFGNLMGVTPAGTDTLERFISVCKMSAQFNYHALFVGLAVVALMLTWPKKWGEKFPPSLAALAIAAFFSFAMRLPVELVGDIPRALVHGSRIGISDIFSGNITDFIIPALSIAALGTVETLLCGVAGGKMKDEKMDSDRELIAQGVGNLILPFLGGVPATAAIARSSVAIKSGGRTRMTGIIQGFVLLLSMFLLSPLMSKIPLAALAGVLIVTAWRMNDLPSIHYIFSHGAGTGVAKYLVTLLATVLFDLTTAIAAGALIAMIIFIAELSELEVKIDDISERSGYAARGRKAEIIYITGPVFFGTANAFEDALAGVTGGVIVISMRGVPYVDISGAQSLHNFCREKLDAGASVLFAGVSPKVKAALDRGGITVMTGETAYFDNVIDAAAVVERLCSF